MGKGTLQQFAVLALYTETPLHCGAESGTGFVDLPVQRERHTNYPVIPGSTIKGVLRDDVTIPDGADREAIVNQFFGAPQATNAGSVAFGDGVLVAFPVRSSGAPFHWVTCPFALGRAFRNLGRPWTVTGSPAHGEAWAAEANRDIVLEELLVKTRDYPSPQDKQAVDALFADLIPSTGGFGYVRTALPARLLVLNDTDFQEIVETSTEVVTRIKLNSQGTTAEITRDDKGNMFVEEVVPSDSLFVAPLRGDASIVSGKHIPPLIRLGGDETIGRGLTNVRVVECKRSSETGKGV